MKKTEEYSVSKWSPYVEHMVASLPKRKVIPTTTQSPSTQAILDRPIEKDEEAKYRVPPITCMYNPNPKNREEMDKAVGFGKRVVSADEVAAYETHRRSSKNTLGDQQDATLNEELRQRAIDAFVYSPSATLDQIEIKRLAKLVGYDSKPMPLEEERLMKKAKKPMRTISYNAGLVFYVTLLLSAGIWALYVVMK